MLSVLLERSRCIFMTHTPELQPQTQLCVDVNVQLRAALRGQNTRQPIKMMLCSFCCPFNLLSRVIYLYIKTFLYLVWEPVTDVGLRLQFSSVSLLLMLEWGSTDDCPHCPIFHVMPVTLGAGNSERQQYDALWLLLCCCCECVMGMNRLQSNVVMHSVLISFVRHWS